MADPTVFVESEAALARLTQAVLSGLRTGLTNFQTATGVPSGLAIDPATGHAFAEFSFVFLDGEAGINAAHAEAVQGAQVDTGTETKAGATKTSTASYGPTTSVQTDGGIDYQHEDRKFDGVS